jgi:hypothetical protein
MDSVVKDVTCVLANAVALGRRDKLITSLKEATKIMKDFREKKCVNGEG